MLKKDSIKSLEQFYQWQNNSDIFRSPVYIRGLLFAVCASPDIPMPEQWFPWVVQTGGEIQSQQVDKVSNILMQLLKEQLQAMRDNQVNLPADCHYPAHEDNLQQWMTGLITGHGLLEEIWQQAWQAMLQAQPETSEQFSTRLTRCLRMFTTFADINLAVQQAKERDAEDFQAKLPLLAKSLSSSLQEYVKLSGELVSYLPHQFDTFQKNMPGRH
ncbi:UPF0149 family protein [Planctobacterium marinum]|uniref:UPF0149 family protein n=1 Tax=Planctobacterium marinum TaxID=1631968 RepID=UPI001E2FA11F|nr:UPF0149 family protein [Planctobacterium marinum]MCC2607673.1 YecA family protein [Planctobacterium marinum]